MYTYRTMVPIKIQKKLYSQKGPCGHDILKASQMIWGVHQCLSTVGAPVLMFQQFLLCSHREVGQDSGVLMFQHTHHHLGIWLRADLVPGEPGTLHF